MRVANKTEIITRDPGLCLQEIDISPEYADAFSTIQEENNSAFQWNRSAVLAIGLHNARRNEAASPPKSYLLPNRRAIAERWPFDS